MLESNKRYPLIRVYFNNRKDFPNVWSVDNGDQENEIILRYVFVSAPGITKFTGLARDEHTPVAWIEFKDAVFRLDRDTAYVS